MATIRKRGQAWQVQIRRDGFPPITKSFRSKADADGWARETERQIERGKLSGQGRTANKLTGGALLQRYELEVTSRKRGQRFEASRIRTFLRSPLANGAVHRLSAQMVAAYRDERLNRVSGLRHCIEGGRKEWAHGSPETLSSDHTPLPVKGERPTTARGGRNFSDRCTVENPGVVVAAIPNAGT